MEPVIQTSAVSLASLIEEISKEGSQEYLIEDVWNRIILFLDAKGMRKLSMISRNICIIVLKSTSYVWYVHNKPKLCNIISKSTLSLHESNESTPKIMASFIKNLLQHGDINTAEKTVLQYKCNYVKAELIDTIAQFQTQQGDIKKANETLTRARNMALSSPNKGFVCRFLVDIIKMQAKCDDIENAKATLEDIKQINIARCNRDYFEFKASLHIAQSQLQCGHIEKVIETIGQVITRMRASGNVHNENKILKEIDALLIEMGDMPDLNKTAQDLAIEYNREDAVLLELQVNGFVQNNQMDAAKQILIDEIEKIFQGDTANKEHHLRYIAAIQSEIDNDDAKNTLERAKGIVLGLQVSDDTVNSLIDIAEEQIQYGDTAGVKDTFIAITGMLEQVQLEPDVLNKIVQCLVELDDITTTKDVLLYMPDTYKNATLPNYNKTNALNGIAEAQFKKGNKAEAISTLKEAKESALLVQESYFKIKALMRVAQATFRYGDVEGTENILREVENTLKEAENDVVSIDDYHKAKSLISIAELQLQMGTVDIAKNTLSIAKEVILQISKDYNPANPNHHKDKVLAMLFKAYLQTGDAENTMEAFKSIWCLHKKIDTLLQVIAMVERQTEKNVPTALISFIEGIQNDARF